MRTITFFIFSALFLFSGAYAATLTSISSGNWSSATTWGATPPGTADDVIIATGHTITMDGAPGNCNSLTINGVADWISPTTTNVGAGGITISQTGTISGSAAGILTSQGGLIINATVSTSPVKIILQTTPNQTISGTGSLPNLDIATGVAANNIGTLIVLSALGGSGTFINSANAVLKIGGTCTITALDATANPNTVEYNGIGAQSVKPTTYHNLNINKSSETASFGGNTVINNNFNIISGISDIGAVDISVSVSTNISGILQFSSVTGIKTFNNIIINNGGKLETFTYTVPITINGNLENNGIFSSSNASYSLTGTDKTISGISGFSFNSSSANITGSYTNNTKFNIDNLLISNSLTNNDTCSVFSSLSGTGTLTQGNNSALFIGVPGSFSLTTLNAFATGNTVIYNGNSIQAIKPLTYYNLMIANTGGMTADFSGTTTVSNDFFISNGSIAGISNYDLNVNNNNTISGTFNITEASGIKTFNNITVNTSGKWNVSVASPVTINGNIQNDGIFTAGFGEYTLTGSSKFIDGSAGLPVPYLTINGTYTNNTNIDVDSVLTGAGTLTQNPNANLFIGKVLSINNLIASANPNTVIYDGNGSQLVKAFTYNNLEINIGAGYEATLEGTITINKDL
ncbi:MAG: hypothetical protein HY738_12830 [Bacteroidia bacterium]|nr:hypothetical protein [Bacteroidia bacterium]